MDYGRIVEDAAVTLIAIGIGIAFALMALGWLGYYLWQHISFGWLA